MGRQVVTSKRLGWGQLIAYGLGGIVPVALFHIAGQLIGLVGNISLGLNALSLGVITNFVPRLWDAFSDPVVGYASDHTRSRFGRRRPYILLGGIGVAVSFVVMWWVPSEEWVGRWLGAETSYARFQLAYILGGVLVFYTACTVFEIPHGALGMELSDDYHERTRLFSAKSFMGNFFAMGTPWLIKLATLDQFRGVGGNIADGMRYVSLSVAVVLIPLSIWWFWALREPVPRRPSRAVEPPGDRGDEESPSSPPTTKNGFWADVWATCSNRTFLRLVAIVFTLAMGFQFVGIFNYYITIFYLYGGDAVASANLMGINGTVWAITGLVAVVPLNLLSQRLGKHRTLALAILCMFLAQLAKVVCYSPTYPYLTILPTILLSSGMLMFFTLGNSMVADICDEDELRTGTRSEGSYYAVFWWFIKLGSAFAGLVMGALLVLTQFDEQQNVAADRVRGSLEIVSERLTHPESGDAKERSWNADVRDELRDMRNELLGLQSHWASTSRVAESSRKSDAEEAADDLLVALAKLEAKLDVDQANAAALAEQTRGLVPLARALSQQSDTALWRLRLFEIGLPMLLCGVSLWWTVGYPLTETRCYEIKAALESREEPSSWTEN